MADRGHELTDDILNGLEEKIADEYAIALSDMQKKLEAYLKQFEAGKAKQKELLDAGKITKKEYDDWVFRHTMMGNQWKAMRDVLASDLEHASEIALKIARSEMPDVYALNANFATYQIEHDGMIDTGFTLYNHDAAELLLKEEDLQLMPGPSTRKAAEIAADESMQWNRQKIQSAVFQGIVQGESPYDVAKRLRSVATMNYNASVRYARTMTTNAQNAGRYEAFRRADDLGVQLTIEWQATLDNRTRHSHRMMHGQRRKVNEPFLIDGFEIMWPAQSHGPGASDIPQQYIWNCRCTLLSWVKGFEGETVKYSPKMGDMSFEEWQNAKVEKQEKSEKNIHQNQIKQLSSKDVSREFLESANPRSGIIEYEPNYDMGKKHEDERKTAEWIYNTFGGDIVVQTEKKGQETADYLWRDSLWELKCPESEKSISKRVQKALSQIFDNPGGIILDIQHLDGVEIGRIEQIVLGRMKTSLKTQSYVIIKKDDLFVKAILYKK